MGRPVKYSRSGSCSLDKTYFQSQKHLNTFRLILDDKITRSKLNLYCTEEKRQLWYLFEFLLPLPILKEKVSSRISRFLSKKAKFNTFAKINAREIRKIGESQKSIPAKFFKNRVSVRYNIFESRLLETIDCYCHLFVLKSINFY